MTHLAAEPGFLETFAGLLRRRPTLEGLPQLTDEVWTLGPLAPDPKRLAAYRSALQLPESDTLPVLFPHVMCGRMHLAMLADPDFPIGMLGAVHTGTEVERLADIEPTTEYMLQANFVAPRLVKRGLEFAIDSRALVGDTVTWRSRNTYLVRTRFGEETPETRPALEPPDPARKTETWKLPANLGRTYAGICGDWNPIHVTQLSARLFGFKSSIVHGYANLAMALGHMGVDPNTLRADFKGPVFLGSESWATHDEQGRFEVCWSGDERPSIRGKTSVS